MKRHIYRILRRIIKRHLLAPVRRLCRRKLSALYASAIERNELYWEVENAFQVQLDDAELQRVETFGGLADYVLRCLLAPQPGTAPRLSA
jgi:hypothetical protein